jgi:uncharacterized protein YebE (UPF0316 family)
VPSHRDLPRYRQEGKTIENIMTEPIIASLTGSDIYAWVILPLLIFLARICDVTLGTVRLIFVSRGFRYLAPITGFFEVLIWIVVIGQIMANLSNPACYLAYAAGFATGNHIGILIVGRLSLGLVLIRVITQKQADQLVDRLREKDYGVTSIDGQGANGPVRVIFTIVKRREVEAIVELVKELNPQAFYSIEEVDFVERGVFPLKKSRLGFELLRPLRSLRKGK